MNAFEREINRFDKEKLEKYKKVAPQLAQGIFPLPRQVTFFPTYHCNHQCPGCLYHSSEGHWQGEISWKDFQHIKRTFQRIGVERIEISGGGEPGCHPHFREILVALAGISSQIGVISNGSTFSKDDLVAIAQHANYTRLSIDSLNAGTYRKMHGRNANLQAVIKNIEALKTLKRELNSGLVIGAKFLITRDNAEELEEIITWSIHSGLDHIQFKAIRQAASELEENTAVRIDKKLQDAKRMNASRTAIYGSLLPIKSRVRCWTAPLYTVVDPLGDLYICCYYHGRKDELRIGNILEDTFEALWGSEKHQSLLSSVNVANCTHDCRFKMYNELLRDYVEGKR